MAYNPIFGTGTSGTPKPDDPSMSALDSIANLNTNPAPAAAPTSLTAPTSATAAPGLGNIKPGVVGTAPTPTPTPVGTSTSGGAVSVPVGSPPAAGATPDAAVVQPEGRSSSGDFDHTSLASTELNPYAYLLGGNVDFAGKLTSAMQNTANAGSLAAQQVGYGTQAASSQIGVNAQNAGNQANALQQEIGVGATDYGYDAAQKIQQQGAGLTAAGQGMGQLAAGVTGRAAPGLDTSQQDASLLAAGQTGDILGGSGLGLLAAGQAAQGRAAPALDAGVQNAALAQANAATGQLGQTGSTMGQLALQAGNRATPAANYGQAQGVLGDSLGTAGRLGTTAQQATAAAQLAGQRQAITADYGQSRSALDQLAGLESGPGMSGAEALLRNGAGMAAQQALLQGHAGRGFGANAQMTADAMRQNAATMMATSNQAAQLRAQEYAQRQQRAASNLTTQAGMLSGQTQAEQAAALQARAQNDQAQAALFGIGNQANTSQASLQQAAAGQLTGQQQADQAAALQARAQNDQTQNALLAGQAAAQQNAAALGQSAAQQYGQQAALNQAAQLQATGQNDSALAALSGLGMQGIAQTAGIQQANAAQQGQQAALNQAAALQATGQNDAAAEAYRQLQLQGMQAGVQAQATGAQVAQQGAQIGGGLVNQGANAAIAGDQLAANAANQSGQLAMNGVLQGTQLQQNALTSTGQIAQIASGMTQAQIDAQLQQYAIREGVGVQTRAQNIGLLGAGLAAAGTIGAAVSDKRAKTKIKSATPEELMLSPGDSLLAPPKEQPSALDMIGNLPTTGERDGRWDYMTGEDIDADPYGLGYHVPNASAPKPPPSAAQQQAAASDAAFQQSAAQSAAASAAQVEAGKQKDATVGNIAGLGGAAVGGVIGGPAGAAIGGLAGKLGGTYLSKAFRKSDVTAKKEIEPAKGSELVPRGPGGPAFEQAMADSAYAEGADGRRARGLATDYFRALPGILQSGSGPPPSFAMHRRRSAIPALESGPILTSDIDEKTDLRAAKGYSYEYKDPDAPGAAHGRQVGPMAQDLLRTSAADAVVKGRDRKLGVDTGRLSLRNTAAISQQQRDIDELKAMVGELSGMSYAGGR